MIIHADGLTWPLETYLDARGFLREPPDDALAAIHDPKVETVGLDGVYLVELGRCVRERLSLNASHTHPDVGRFPDSGGRPFSCPLQSGYMGSMSEELKPEGVDRRGSSRGQFGQPPHEVTPERQATVERMAGLQVSQAEIAMVMGVSIDTIQRHYAAEFEKGRAMQGIKLREHAYTLAYGKLKDVDKPNEGYVPQFPPDPRMTQFLLERQFGMVQQTRQEHVGNPDQPVEIRHIRRVVVDPREEQSNG